jgi:DNA-binding response OmpR family regulator
MFSSTIIEDDSVQAELLGALLKNHDIRSEIVGSYKSACKTIDSGLKSDLVILDYDLGDSNGDGVDLCRRIEAASDIPIVVLTANDNSNVVIDFLNAGAKRFVAKPYQSSELLHCIRQLLPGQKPTTAQLFGVGYDRPKLDFNLMKVVYKGIEFPMPAKELELFELLIDNEGKTVFRQDINFLLSDGPVNPRYADTMITKLRSRLARLPGDFRIRSIRGVGYKLTWRN